MAEEFIDDDPVVEIVAPTAIPEIADPQDGVTPPDPCGAKRNASPAPHLFDNYKDLYKGLPVAITGPEASEMEGFRSKPVHYKGYTGIIKTFNPNNQIAQVELGIVQKLVNVNLESLRF
jgi:hypothetical protein